MDLAQGKTTQSKTRGDTATAPAESGDFNTRGEMLGSSLIGATVRSKANETAGEIEEVYIDNSSVIKGVVVQVGSLLGVGSRYVNMPWNQLSFAHDKNDLVIVTSANKDALQKMPEYKYQKRNGTSG